MNGRTPNSLILTLWDKLIREALTDSIMGSAILICGTRKVMSLTSPSRLESDINHAYRIPFIEADSAMANKFLE
jgi:hypothetical protein